MKIHNAFVTGIGQFEYTDVSNLKSTVEEIVLNSDINYEWTNGLNPKLNHWYSHDSSVLENMSTFKPIADWMKLCVDEYAKEVGYNVDLFCTEIWINVNKGGQQYFHTHTNSVFSSTLYVEFDPDDHPGLTFDRPDGSNKPAIEVKPARPTNFTAESFTPHLKPGSMLVWPSQVSHGYYAENMFQKGKHRVSISANYMTTSIDNGVYSFKISRNR